MTIRIDKDIPPPTNNARGERANLVNQMKHGDSIFVTDPKEYTAYRSIIQHHGYKVIGRKEGKGWRIWKLKREN